MIDGVCGGVAEYFGLDPTLVRIVWVLLTLLGGSGILIYIVAMIIMPANPNFAFQSGGISAVPSSANSHRFWGILLVIVGVLLLMSNLGLWHRWWGFSWDIMFPTILILAGIAFLFGGRSYVSGSESVPSAQAEPSGAATSQSGNPAQQARLYRSRAERKLFGVCGGLGVYFGIDPTIVRILFLVAVFASFGLAVFAYVLMAIIVPEEPWVFVSPGS
jgi:phage shock protein C